MLVIYCTRFHNFTPACFMPVEESVLVSEKGVMEKENGAGKVKRMMQLLIHRGGQSSQRTVNCELLRIVNTVTKTHAVSLNIYITTESRSSSSVEAGYTECVYCIKCINIYIYI